MTRDWNQIVRQGFVAGLIAGVTLWVYLYATVLIPTHMTPVQQWQWIASAALGQIAYSSPSYALLGLIMHFIVSIGWAGGYAYLAQQQTFMNARWYISGIVYGAVVYIFMDLILLGVRMFIPPPPLGLLNALVAHCIFFGLPLAYVIARTSKVTA